MLNQIKQILKNKEHKPLTIRELLHGCTIGRMQTVGLMQVIPLLSDFNDTRFASTQEVKVSTAGYGNMVFENTSNKPLIVPCHAGYVVKQAAQDHAMSHSAILKGFQSKTFETAMCIQQTQGGYISPDKHKLLVLPYSLREKALSVRNLKNYSKLWDDINNFNVKLGASSGGMLVNFLKKFEKELDHFVAEFEIVPKQVGAIILIDGEVVGIEKTPSYEYWTSIWNALIRECYGSRALEVAKSYQGRELPAFKSSLGAENINTLQDLEEAIKKAKQKQEDIAHKKVRELVDNTFAVETEEKLEGFEVNTIENIQFVGQVIRDHDKVCYISLVTSQNWVKNQAWYKAPAFSI